MIIFASFITGLMPTRTKWKIARSETGLQFTDEIGKDSFTIPLTFPKSTFFKPTVISNKDRGLVCVANGLNETEVWSTTTKTKLFDVESPAAPLHFSPQGKWLVVRQTDGTLEFWNVETKTARTLPEYVQVKKLADVEFGEDEASATLFGTLSRLMKQQIVLDKNDKPIEIMPKMWVTQKNDRFKFDLNA